MLESVRYIVMLEGKFQTPRRATKVMYENRSGWSENIDDARVYQTKGVATSSALGGKVVPVNITVSLTD